MKKYYPILLSKSGELNALAHLDVDVRKDISPVIEILSGEIARVQDYLSVDWNFDDNEILIDFSNYGDIEPEITTVRDFFVAIIDAGVTAIPVIQQNSHARYLRLVRSLVNDYGIDICIRISNDGGDITDLDAILKGLMKTVGSNTANTLLLIDLGFAEEINVNMLSALAVGILRSIPTINEWKCIIVASGSFPQDLTNVRPANRVHRLPRYEWNIWLRIQKLAAFKDIVKYV
jgi:hypothetical protein